VGHFYFGDPGHITIGADKNLQRAGLILQQRVSRQLIYSADFEVMNGLIGYLTENCCAGSGSSCGEVCEPVRPKKGAKRAAKVA